MKNFLFVAFIFAYQFMNAQWVSEVVDNHIDDPSRMSYCFSSNKRELITFGMKDGKIDLVLFNGYYCPEYPKVDISLLVNGKTERYSFIAYTNESKNLLMVVQDLESPKNSDFLLNFKKATKMFMRVNQENCTDDYHQFDITDTDKALRYIKGY